MIYREQSTPFWEAGDLKARGHSFGKFCKTGEADFVRKQRGALGFCKPFLAFSGSDEKGIDTVCVCVGFSTGI